MQQDQQMMIFMLLVVMALMMSRDTHKLFAETTRTWAQFGSSNYKAISALTTIAMLAIGRGVWKNQQDIKDIVLKGRLLRPTRDPIEKRQVKEFVDLTGVPPNQVTQHLIGKRTIPYKGPAPVLEACRGGTC
jgi:hypothetical protein